MSTINDYKKLINLKIDFDEIIRQRKNQFDDVIDSSI